MIYKTLVLKFLHNVTFKAYGIKNIYSLSVFIFIINNIMMTFYLKYNQSENGKNSSDTDSTIFTYSMSKNVFVRRLPHYKIKKQRNPKCYQNKWNVCM